MCLGERDRKTGESDVTDVDLRESCIFVFLEEKFVCVAKHTVSSKPGYELGTFSENLGHKPIAPFLKHELTPY